MSIWKKKKYIHRISNEKAETEEILINFLLNKGYSLHSLQEQLFDLSAEEEGTVFYKRKRINK